VALPSRRSTGRALTASAVKLSARETAYSKRLSQPWQLRSLGYYDAIGEINFTAKFLARQISRVRFFPVFLNDDGTKDPIESGLPVEILNQIQDPGGGRSQLQYDYGRLMLITGEGVLFAYDDFAKWRFLWKDEIKKTDDGRYVRLDLYQQPTDDVGVAYRFWSPHPRHSDEADAPMRAVQDIAEELLILTLGVRATALTRMTKGVVKIPTQLSPNPLSVGMDEDPEQNPLMSDWIEHTTAQIEDPSSVQAMVPFALEGDYEYLDRFEWMKTHDPATDYMERDLRKEAIQRLAFSLEMSPEDLIGYTNANHWTGRQVQLDRWRVFGYGKAEQFATNLADAYLRPSLREEEFADWMRIGISFDDSQVVISPDRTEDALKAQAQGIINNAAAREALGWTEEDKLDGDEELKWLAQRLRDPMLLEEAGISLPARGPLPAQNGRNAADGPPPPGANSGVSRRESMQASSHVHGAAVAALMRCRELAGVRIKHKCEDCGGASLSVVAAGAPAEYLAEPLKLVHGGTDFFRTLLTEWGWAAEQTSSLCQQLEVYAARTLCEPKCPELPSGFVAAVEKAREVSEALT
jgi:hypothetical protein